MEEVDVLAEGTAKAFALIGNIRKTGATSRWRRRRGCQTPKLVTPVYPQAAKSGRHPGYRDPPCHHRYGRYSVVAASDERRHRPWNLRVSAVEAVSKWRYRPTLLNGEPIEVDTTIMVNFKLLS